MFSSFHAFLPWHTAWLVSQIRTCPWQDLSAASPLLKLQKTLSWVRALPGALPSLSACMPSHAGHCTGLAFHSLQFLPVNKNNFEHLLCTSISVCGRPLVVYKAKENRFCILVNKQIKSRVYQMVISAFGKNKAGKWDKEWGRAKEMCSYFR